MADDKAPTTGTDVQGVVSGVSVGDTRQEYTFGGHPDDGVGDEVFHRDADTIKKGDKVMLTDAAANELRDAGFKLTGKKS